MNLDIKYFELNAYIKEKINPEYPMILLNMNLWLEFLGTYLIYGSILDQFIVKIDIEQSKFKDASLKLQKYLGFLIEYSNIFKVFIVHNVRIATYLVQFNDLNNRVMPKWCLNLNTNQSRILLNSMVKSDNIMKNIKSKSLINDIQILATNANSAAV